MIPNWSPRPPQWLREEGSLPSSGVTEPADMTSEAFIEKSSNFPRNFPIETNKCSSLKSIVDKEILERNINSAYPVLHENVLNLYANFIIHKQEHGNSIEKSLYKDMDIVKFVDRLLTKRAATFMGKRDLWMLMNGIKGSQKWETIGTSNEQPPLILQDCLSYEEIKLSAFLSVSSYTYFVNLGDRKNFGVFKKEREDIEDEGIIMGIIGPRLVKDEVMDYQELVITEKQNTRSNGYGDITPPTIHQLFAKFYDEDCLEYKDVLRKKNEVEWRYTDLKKGEIFDNLVYYKRLLFTVDTLFLEANQRALEKNTTAYIHVVGIGLGVWKKSPHQLNIFVDSCGQRLKVLGQNLKNVSDVCFSYITCNSCLGVKHGNKIPIENHPLGGIKIHIYKREPHSKLTGSDSGKLLVVSYAWDGNALPGNEFWLKKLGSSGDSAAASSTQIAELHNAFINPKVCGCNLRVATEFGIVKLNEYVERVKGENERKRSD